jgi:hypothetical protein
MKALRITRSCSCPEPELASGVVVIRGAPAAATCRLLLDNLCPPLHLLHLHSCLGVNAAAALRYLLGAARRGGGGALSSQTAYVQKKCSTGALRS